MKTKYSQEVIDMLIEKEISASTGDVMAIYRVAGISTEKGITLKFVRQIGGKPRNDWVDCCLNFTKSTSYSGTDQELFDWFIAAIMSGHFDLDYSYKRFGGDSGVPSTCAL